MCTPNAVYTKFVVVECGITILVDLCHCNYPSLVLLYLAATLFVCSHY